MRNFPTAAAFPPGTVTLARPKDLSFVLDLQKRFSNQLGFLPRQAVVEYLDARRILIARENGDAAGYILGPRRMASLPGVVPLVQTAIAFDAQRRGLGLALVSAAAAAAAADGRSFLQAWCRADLTANEFWRAAGFLPIAQRRTDNARRQPLVLWRLSLTADFSPSLLALPRRAGSNGRTVTDARHLTAGQLTAILSPPTAHALCHPAAARRTAA